MSCVVPIHRPSGSRHAIKLNFLTSDDETLVVAKASQLEIYEQSQDGYTLVHTRSVYGYITMLERLHSASSSTDHLFVGTDRYQYFTCSWDAATKQIRTEQSYVDQADKVLRDSRDMDRCHIDPTRRFLTLELYDGIVTVVPIETPSERQVKRDSTSSERPGSLGEPVQVRIEELVTRSSAFVQTDPDDISNPRLAILWEDNQEVPQLKIRELRYSGGENPSADLVTVAELREQQLDEGVSHLIPIAPPYGGFLILGERYISYADNNLRRFFSRPLGEDARIWACWTKVDDRRFLLADDYGKLFFLMIETSQDRISNWRLDAVGSASRASSLVYLDEGRVYVGSHSGDSQIVQIVEGGVEVLQTFANIAPILDFSIMDLGRGNEGGPVSDFSSGQARIVTASGAWENGSIRSVRSGVSMEDLGTIAPLTHITDMWALDSRGGDVQDTLIVSFIDETKVLHFGADDSIEELAEFSQFELSQPTLFARNLTERKIVQVFETGLRITDLDSEMLLLDWTPTDSAAKITAASANSVHLLVVESGNTLHVFHAANHESKPTLSKTFPSTSQISSVTAPDSESNVCIVSFWQTGTVSILDLHSLEQLHSQSLGAAGAAIPRSVLIANVLPDAPPTLFIAIADGSIVTFSFDTGRNTLSGMTKILLGTEPAFFKLLPRESYPGLCNVFASCEQPSLIYSSEGRIVYSAVNSDKASRVCHFSPAAYPGAVAIASPSELKLALLGRERATQLQTLPIGETVRCLAYESKAHIFGMGCIRRIVEGSTEALLSSFKVADEIGFKELDSHELDDQELVECVIATGPFEGGEDTYDEMFVVGTSLTAPGGIDGEAIDRGRILVFEVNKEKKIRLVTEVGIKGACRSLAMCDGKIMAGLVKTVVLYGLVPSSRHGLELKKLASYRTSTNPLSLAVTPSTPTSHATVAVADLMKSLSIVEILPPTSAEPEWQITEISRHFATVWSSAVAVIGEHEWVLADMEGNLAIVNRNPEGVTADDKKRLQVTGEFRLGEIVNKIVPIFGPVEKGKGKGKDRSRTLSSTNPRGTMDICQPERNGPLIVPKAFLATVEGAIYMLGAINPSYIDALLRLQGALASRVQAPGYMPWARYRAWKTEVREADEPFRFVDGEVLEQGLMKLSDGELEAALREADLAEGDKRVQVEEARRWGEELRRLY